MILAGRKDGHHAGVSGSVRDAKAIGRRIGLCWERWFDSSPWLKEGPMLKAIVEIIQAIHDVLFGPESHSKERYRNQR